MKRRKVVAALAAFPVSAMALGEALKAPSLERPFADDVPLTGPGQNLVRIASATIKLPKRTEFETSLMYQERLAPLLRKVVYGSVTLADRLAFKVPFKKHASSTEAAGWNYDPEAGVVTIEPGFGPGLDGVDAELRLQKFLEIKEVDVFGKRAAKTQAGKPVTIQQVSIDKAVLMVSVPSGFLFGEKSQRPLSPRDAATTLPNASLWIVGTVIPPYGVYEQSEEMATTKSDPYDRLYRTVTLIFKASELILVGQAGVPMAKFKLDDE